MQQREKGTIKKYLGEKGYGFISRAGQNDLFFHVSQCVCEDESDITVGRPVEFEIDEKDGRLRALNMVLL